jgi:MFS family permease
VVLAPAIGPSVGGVLVEHFGWQSIFFVVVPFCLVVLVLIRRYLSTNSPLMGDARRFDWKGLLLAGTCTVTVLNGLVHLHDDRVLAMTLLAVALASFIGFIAWQARTDAPLMNLKLFSYRQFSMGGLVAFIYGMGLFGSTYLLPVYLQMALAYSPSRAGLVLLPAGIVLAITIPLAGKMADRYPPNVLVSIGLVLLSLSLGLMALGQPGGSYLLLMGWAVIGRVGLGFVLPALSLGAMRGVEHSLIAQGASTLNFLRQLGGAIGVSLVGIVLEWRLAIHRSGSGIAAVDMDNRLHAFDETFFFVAVLCAIAVVAAWRMRAAPVPSL